MPRRPRRKDYTVGWVCALPVELAAAKLMLDNTHRDITRGFKNDENIYCLGSVAGHNVVIGCLPAGHIGNPSATAVATQMQATFKGLRFGLMVGTGGGVPSAGADIRLGDVVVSQPQWSFGGVVQYGLGRAEVEGFRRIGALNSPPRKLLSAVSAIQSSEMLGRSTLSDHMSILETVPTFCRSRAGPDLLFRATYKHKRGERGNTCDHCSVKGQQPRAQREKSAEVVVHYGTIASGELVMANAAERDRISAELGGVLCFEMEAAGLMNNFPCLIIRGISDYADSHKNYQWQARAAGTAAAYAKELLSVIPAAEVTETRRAEEVIDGTSKRGLEPSFPNHVLCKRIKTKISDNAESDVIEQRTVTLPIHSQEPLKISRNDQERQSLLDSLDFEQIGARQMTIKAAHSKTCRWLLETETYLEWLDTTKMAEHHGFLWIKGNAGTGKSTLMKFALENAIETMKNHVVLSFFFNARGEDLEKSAIGSYRSLLLQLLKRLPALQSVFDSLSLSTSMLDADYQWKVESLKTLLEQAIRSLGDSSVVCFIDALDECEEEQVRRMVDFFEHVGDLAVSNGICFRVCFSSRHYPHITIGNGTELILEGQEGHVQDITNYIEAKLKIGKSKIAQQVRVEFQEKASGIFMWVVLVVDILNKESDRGQVHVLRRKLREIPGDLHELFHDILTRDTHNKDGLVLCIQWILFAKQPLSPEQLYHAILSGVDLEAVTEWDPEEITKDVVRRFILDSSKGLVEVTASSKQRVQFIHESVRDFLLKENGLGKIWPEFGSNFPGQSHERLKKCCLNYISMDVATILKLPTSMPNGPSEEAKSLRNSAALTFPFLEYATRSVLYHADTAEGGGISQAEFLDSFPIPQWVQLDKLFEKRHVRKRHTKSVSLLYLLAELDMANLIVAIGSVSHCTDLEFERYGCPLFAAAAMSSEKALELCLESIDIQRADNTAITAVSEQPSHHESAQRTARFDFVYSWPKPLILCAAELGSDRVLARLIQSGRYRLDSKGWGRRTLLWWAARNNCGVSARLLLAADPAMINIKDTNDRTPLLIAAEQGSHAVMKVLLEMSDDIDAQIERLAAALWAASHHGHKEMVTVLLNNGADVNGGNEPYFTPLQAASARGHKDIVKLLLNQGADVNAQGGYYGNALQGASAGLDEDIVKLLLDQGADINAQGGKYGNALQAASARGYKDLIKLLLNQGAEVNAPGGYYGNALQAASAEGHKDTVKLLLNQGADINAPGRFDNAIQAASARGYKEIATLLQERSKTQLSL